MSDAVIKIGAIVDKEAIASGMAEGAASVSANTVKMSMSFTELQGRATGAWKKISDDTKAASQTVGVESLRIAESTKQVAAAQAELRAALNLTKNANVDAAVSTAVLAAAQDSARIKALELKAAQEAIAVSSHAAVSGVQATSAAIRSLEGNAGLRAVENFLAKTLGLGPALQKLFPLIGAAAFGKIIFDIGEKAVEMWQKTEKGARSTTQAFEALHDKAQVNIDDLTIQNDKLEEERAKLGGHPGNGLQTALDEARRMADRLLDSLQNDRKELESLLKEHEVGAFASAVSSLSSTGRKVGTGKQGEELIADQEKLTEQVRKANATYNAALLETKDPAVIKAATDARNATVKAAFDSQIAAYRKEAARLDFEQHHGLYGDDGLRNNKQRIANVTGRANQLQDLSNVDQLEHRISDNQIAVGDLKKGKEDKGSEDKANEQRFKAMEAHVAEWQTLGPVTAQAIYDYWDMQRNAFTVGSAQYNSIIEKQAQIAEAGARKTHEAIVKIKAEDAKLKAEGEKVNIGLMSPAAGAMGKEALDNVARAGEKWDGYFQSLTKGDEITASINRSLEEGRIRMLENIGSITPLAAAQQMAAVHTKQHADALKALEAELERLEKVAKRDPLTGNVTDPKQAEKIQSVQNQIAQQKGNAQVQGQADQGAIQNAVAKPYEAAFQQITTAWNSTVLSILNGQKKIGAGALQLANTELSAGVAALLRLGEKHLAHYLLVDVLHLQSAAKKTAVDAASASTQVATASTANVATVLSDAAVAAAGAYAATALIPFVGPELAPAAAAASYAGAASFAPMAAFEQGTMFVPREGAAILHPNEAVLGGPSAQVMRDAMSGKLASDGGRDGDLNLNFGGNSFANAGGDFRSQWAAHERHIVKRLRTLRREGHI